MPRMRRMSLAMVVGLSSLIVGCACDESEPRAGAGNAQAVAEQTPPPQPSESDSDGDGVLDLDDAESDDPSVSSSAEEAETPEPTATPDPTDCDGLGINADELNEGICQSEGTKLQVVDKDSQLKLDEVIVAYHGVSYADSLTTPISVEAPFGRFVIVNVTVTNRGDSPINLPAYEMFALTLTQGDRTKTYRADFGAMNMPGPSLVWSDAAADLHPKAAVTGTVVFDVPETRVDLVEKSGNLHVLQPSDVWSPDGPKKRQGLIRLHN
jgi:hypothetical protein